MVVLPFWTVSIYKLNFLAFNDQGVEGGGKNPQFLSGCSFSIFSLKGPPFGFQKHWWHIISVSDSTGKNLKNVLKKGIMADNFCECPVFIHLAFPDIAIYCDTLLHTYLCLWESFHWTPSENISIFPFDTLPPC